MISAYDEAIEFLAQGLTAAQLLGFQPSVEASARFEWLVAREKSEGLLPAEREELDRVMEVERVLALAKARARARQATESR